MIEFEPDPALPSGMAVRRKPEPVTSRELFCAVLASGPLLRADAIVLLTGDGEARLPVAVELFTQNAAPVIVISGGRNDPPYHVTALELAPLLMSRGVALDKIVVEPESRNTKGQAVNVIALASEKGWRRILLVTSPYASPRAFLSFLKAVQDVGEERALQLVNVPASHLSWWGKPEGLKQTRLTLLSEELRKTAEYQEQGYAASYEEGLEYLRYWEER